MSRRRGFRLDLSSCTGCKACQVACKDKHELPVGVLWRRVVEVTGGVWAQRDDAWIDRTFTYFMSVACMHCEQPICVEVCPTKAMQKGEDGIVFVEAKRCIGCSYCAWACPYAAPQLDSSKGVMTKCDACRDHLALGRDPACVEACPMRVLTWGDLPERDDASAAIFPLPPTRLTQPSSAFAPHRDVERARGGGARIGNEEEL